MIQYHDNFDNESILPFVIGHTSYSSRGQVQLCHNPVINIIGKGSSPYIQEISEELKGRYYFTISKESVT